MEAGSNLAAPCASSTGHADGHFCVFEMKLSPTSRHLRCHSPTEFLTFTLLIGFLCSLHSPAIVTAYYPDYHTYHNLQAIGDELASLAHDFPGVFELHTIGSSRENRPITAATLFDNRGARSRQCPPPTVLLSSGEHAREFIPVEVLIALMRNLSKASASGRHDELLQHLRVIAVPMANPDGRALLEQKQDWCWRGMPNGVDINRNFPWEFGGFGSSADPKNEEYKGPFPLSEPESLAMASIFDASSPAAAYASLHSGSQVIYTPYSDTVSKASHRLPPDHAVGVNLAAEMAAQSGGFYTETGVVYEKNDYTADGTLSDWASAVMKVPLVFTFEMFGDPKAGDMSNCFEQFNPETSRVSHCVQQQLPALLFLLQHVARRAELECEQRARKESTAAKTSFQAKGTLAAQSSFQAKAVDQAQMRAQATQVNGSPSVTQSILHDMSVLSRDLHDAQAALQHARLKLVASLKARGISQL